MSGETEDNLCIFEGMEGFEGLNSSDDSTLVALLDDLQEETLINLLDDNFFAKNLTDFPLGNRSRDDDLFSHTLPCSEELSEMYLRSNAGLNPSDFLVRKELMCDSDKESKFEVDHSSPYMVKRAKLDSSLRDDTETTFGYERALTSVMHDHCYSVGEGLCQPPSSNTNSDEEASNEEGSNSDAGYDTMSASTSPGTAHSKSKEFESTPSVLSPVSAFPVSPSEDPVVLIDARIKHYMSTREVNLTEEEKEILKAEGLPIPTTLPLTKVEEKALKNVRRKVRNKVAAQESRKRKKEFLQSLEERVSSCDRENLQLKSRVKTLETENKCLLEDLKKLRGLLGNASQKASHTKVGTYIMVIILCFAVFYGGQSSSSIWTNQKQFEYTTSSVRSRSLLSMDSRVSFHMMACDWFRQIFMRQSTSDFSQSANELYLQDDHSSSAVQHTSTLNHTACY